MRDFPSCFGENGVQVADASSSSGSSIVTSNKIAQSLVTCVYQCRLRNFSCLIITVTWTKTLMGQGLSVEIDDSTNQCLCKVEIKPWLFSKRRGFKNLEVGSKLIDIYWDLASAKFASSSPEPLEGFYFAIVVNQDLILMLGDMEKEVQKKINASGFAPNVTFISKKEHIFGKKVYATRAQFCGKGQIHDILIECDVGVNDPCLFIRVDGKTMIQVKHLRWKFRGNYTILVDGLPVEVYWDVHSWLFGKLTGDAVFLFQTCLSAEKLWAVQSGSNLSWSGSNLSWSGSFGRDSHSQGLGFSLVLCAWKHE